ncbi:MAG: N-acetylneuraminate synthase family protein [Spirochaetaceae bacterium]|nr:N-acetylneuraminate synthase family protein [Spirochaetaceae bacterium]
MVIIAEIGTAHKASLNLAQNLIMAAKEAGADVVKFQAIIADEIVHPNVGQVPLPGGQIDIYQSFKQLEQPLSFYAQLKELTEAAGLQFLCTPFGLKSLAMLNQLGVNSYKVASPELNHLPLLTAMAKLDRPILLSLGVSKLSDIEEALAIVGIQNTTLLHCVTSYPAPEADYNLRLLPHLKAIFNVEVGVSDHSKDSKLVPTLATYMGATVIEKHICLSRNDDGLDDPIALEPQQFKEMVKVVKAMQHNKEQAFNDLIAEYGAKQVEAVLGNGHKILAPSEAANYGRTNRSVCAVNNINKGELFTAANTALYRAEKKLKVGLPPKLWPVIVGRTARYTITAGNGITFEDIA